jgi:hypothetical protein
MADRFEEVTGKLALVAVKQVPMLGVIVEAVEALLPPNADERLKAAIAEDMGDTLIKLQQKVEQLAARLESNGQKLDDLGPIRTVHVARDVAESTAQARSPEKREAVLNAAARQFDPNLSASARAHWLAVVRQLSDIEIAAIRVLHTEGALWQQHDGTLARVATQVEENATPLDLERYPVDDQHALRVALRDLGQPYVYGEFGEGGVALTYAGEALARFTDAVAE